MGKRLPAQPGEWIDRSRPLHFRFEGQEYSGFAGDTISTALWASGVRVLGRSFKYHRPRGLFGLADIDCNAMMETSDRTNIRADLTPIEEGMDLKAVNTLGGVRHDRLRLLDYFGALTPVGFYYKAFHTPKSLFPFYENRIRQMAGLGHIKEHLGMEPSPKNHAFADLLVVGGGPAGLSAALEAARRGVRVMLVDENPHLGGSLSYQHLRAGGTDQLSNLLGDLANQSHLQVRQGSTAVGWYADHWIGLVDDSRLTKLRARATLVASGCYEQPAVFRNNDLPGVMLGSAAQRLIHRYAVQPFSKGVVLAANSDGYRVALDLLEAGTSVEAIADLRPGGEDSALAAECTNRGIEIYRSHTIYEASSSRGKRGIRQVVLCPCASSDQVDPTQRRVLSCDGVVVSVGWAPADSLLRQARTRMGYDSGVEQFVPVELAAGVFAAGRVNGVYDLSSQIEDGRRAGREAAAYLRSDPLPRTMPQQLGPPQSHPYPVVPHPKAKNFVDLDEDGEDEYFIPALGMFNEDQAAAGGDGTDLPWPQPVVPPATPIQVIGY